MNIASHPAMIDNDESRYYRLLDKYITQYNITGTPYKNANKWNTNLAFPTSENKADSTEQDREQPFIKPSFIISNEVTTFTGADLDLKNFQPHGDHDDGHSPPSTPIIPHIIHQTWDTYNVPKRFVPWIESVLRYHPSWQYWFWTQKDIVLYFKRRHPEFLDLYSSYSAMIFKTDVIRYFILYDFGGVYLDLDIEVFRPLDVWTYVAPSLLTHETYIHSFLVHKNRNRPNVMTTVLASVPGHPYYK